ncbi:acyl--CoA ligase [Nanchangia anserum]|uniref:AMP-binding enzyme n=1 Tax=Nanchangia anserum TaxID=2692125 RepID=UPI0018843BF2|nr:acyl--CoA ligase [Nanchangia anserum]
MWIGGPGSFSGYRHDGGLQPPSWHHIAGTDLFDSGDLGFWDEQGYLTITGRASRMIPTGGELLAPSQVETALIDVAGMLEAAVIGVPDDYWGQAIAAVCVPGTQALPLDEVRRLLRPHVAGWKLPRHLHYVESLPLTASGKVDYRRLAEFFA